MVISIQPANHSSIHDAEEDTNQPTNHQAKWYASILAMSRNDDGDDDDEVGGGCRGRGLQLVDDTSSTSTFFVRIQRFALFLKIVWIEARLGCERL